MLLILLYLGVTSFMHLEMHRCYKFHHTAALLTFKTIAELLYCIWKSELMLDPHIDNTLTGKSGAKVDNFIDNINFTYLLNWPLQPFSQVWPSFSHHLCCMY